MTKADELWEKYCHEDRRGDGGQYMMWDDFLAALQKYGEAVRAEARKVCEKEANRLAEIGFHNESYTSTVNAAAIKEMKLP